MNNNTWGDVQICISVPLKDANYLKSSKNETLNLMKRKMENGNNKKTKETALKIFSLIFLKWKNQYNK